MFKQLNAGLKFLLRPIVKPILCSSYKLIRSKQFTFNKKTYNYFYHTYNSTWNTERIVEVPVITELLTQFNGHNTLEIGNVLSHYFKIEHDVVDKYEVGKNVLNVDVVDFKPNKKYDLIISISTLEHVGFDEEKKDDLKVLRAIEHIRGLLSEKGLFVFTIPLGYNTNIDKFIQTNKLHADQIFYLRRISKANEWVEENSIDFDSIKYNSPYSAGNAVAIGIISNNNK